MSFRLSLNTNRPATSPPPHPALPNPVPRTSAPPGPSGPSRPSGPSGPSVAGPPTPVVGRPAGGNVADEVFGELWRDRGVRGRADVLLAGLAIGLLVFGCIATMLMYMPERIDHHGWQLAMLSLTVAGLCDPRGPRGGAIVGLASAVSLTIGL